MTKIEWRDVEGKLTPFVVSGTSVKEALWAPQEGSQTAFLTCPVFEAVLEGNRGGGKTDTLLMDFAQHVGVGFGAEWRGILFRQSYKQLQDVVAKSKKWFNQLFPGAKFNEQGYTWTFPAGEQLLFRYIQKPDDYWNYHGSSFPWVGFEELTTWANLDCYKRMMSTCRSPHPKIPKKYRSTTNPYGPGHNVVKERFHLPVQGSRVVGPIIKEDGVEDRVAIHSRLMENKVLLHADPHYIRKIRESARNPSELAAWLEGSWDIVAGGMFDDVWDKDVHVLPAIDPRTLPSGWKLDRAYDHGMSRPFSVGWYAESNGEPIEIGGRTVGQVPGDTIRFKEWYGSTGKPNEGLRMLAIEIGRNIREREASWGIWGKVRKGPADSAIFDDYEPGKSVAGDMAKSGVLWDRADKGPGSRSQGWEQLRKRLKSAIPKEEGSREDPGLFVTEDCKDFLRTFPVLPRDDKKIDDVDTDAEDHIGDEVRYRMRKRNRTANCWDM